MHTKCHSERQMANDKLCFTQSSAHNYKDNDAVANIN